MRENDTLQDIVKQGNAEKGLWKRFIISLLRICCNVPPSSCLVQTGIDKPDKRLTIQNQRPKSHTLEIPGIFFPEAQLIEKTLVPGEHHAQAYPRSHSTSYSIYSNSGSPISA